jgi:hypothetical protein
MNNSLKARWLRGEISNEEYNELVRRARKAAEDEAEERMARSVSMQRTQYTNSDKYKQRAANRPKSPSPYAGSAYASPLSKAKTSLTQS